MRRGSIRSSRSSDSGFGSRAVHPVPVEQTGRRDRRAALRRRRWSSCRPGRRRTRSGRGSSARRINIPTPTVERRPTGIAIPEGSVMPTTCATSMSADFPGIALDDADRGLECRYPAAPRTRLGAARWPPGRRRHRRACLPRRRPSERGAALGMGPHALQSVGERRCATSSADSEPLNESGAMTIFFMSRSSVAHPFCPEPARCFASVSCVAPGAGR